MRLMRSMAAMLAAGVLLVTGVHAEEITPTQKLCAGYEKKKVMLERRLRLGARSWERPRIQAQLDKVNADRAKFCAAPATPASAASGKL